MTNSTEGFDNKTRFASLRAKIQTTPRKANSVKVPDCLSFRKNDYSWKY